MQDHDEPMSGPERHAAVQATLKNLAIGALAAIILTGALGLTLIAQTEQGLGPAAVFSYGVALVHAAIVMAAAAGAFFGLGMLAGLSATVERHLASQGEVLDRFERRAADRLPSIERQLMEAIDSLSELRRQVGDHDRRMSAAEQQHRAILAEQTGVIGTAIHAAEDELHPRRDGREHN